MQDEEAEAIAETEELLRRYREEKEALVEKLLNAGVMPMRVIGKSLKQLREIDLNLWGG